MKKEVLGVIFAVDFGRYRLLELTWFYIDCEIVSDSLTTDSPKPLHTIQDHIYILRRTRSGDGAQASLERFCLPGPRRQHDDTIQGALGG